MQAAQRDRAVVALLAATFVISVAFGLNMPLLPPLIAAVVGERAAVARHAGLLAAVFTFALGAFAPAWGACSDRIGRKPVLLLGMVGFSLAVASFSVPVGLGSLYAVQLLTGVAAAAVMPVSSALVADLAPDDHWRATRLAWLNMALVAGFVLGPVAGSAPDRLLVEIGRHARLVTPFVGAALAGMVAAGLLWAWIPRGRPLAPSRSPVARAAAQVGGLLALTFAVSLAVGVFEVAIAVRGGRILQLAPVRVGALFSACAVVMFAAQAAVFSGRGEPRRSASLLGPAFAGLALGLAAASVAVGFATYAAAVSLFAASGGVLVPALAYWMSRRAGRSLGGQLGRQTAAAGLGQAVGSAFAGLMFDSGAPDGAALLTGAVLMAGTAVFAWRLARGLAPTRRADPML